MQVGNMRVFCNSTRVFLKISRVCTQLHEKFVCGAHTLLSRSPQVMCKLHQTNVLGQRTSVVHYAHTSDLKTRQLKQTQNSVTFIPIDLVSLRVCQIITPADKHVLVTCAHVIYVFVLNETMEGCVIPYLKEVRLAGNLPAQLQGKYVRCCVFTCVRAILESTPRVECTQVTSLFRLVTSNFILRGQLRCHQVLMHSQACNEFFAVCVVRVQSGGAHEFLKV